MSLELFVRGLYTRSHALLSRVTLASAGLSCLALCLNISKTVEDTSICRKLHMRFWLARRSMTLNCYKLEFSGNFMWFRLFGKQQRLHKCCLRQNCTPLNVLFSDIYSTLILVGVTSLGSTIGIQ